MSPLPTNFPLSVNPVGVPATGSEACARTSNCAPTCSRSSSAALSRLMEDAMRIAIAAVLILSAGGCSFSRQIHGVVEGTGETFVGTATGKTDETGSIEIRSSRTTCRGSFVYTTFRQGAGTAVCDDGRKGSLSFESPGWRGGAGTGTFGRRRVTFTFG